MTYRVNYYNNNSYYKMHGLTVNCWCGNTYSWPTLPLHNYDILLRKLSVHAWAQGWTLHSFHLAMYFSYITIIWIILRVQLLDGKWHWLMLFALIPSGFITATWLWFLGLYIYIVYLQLFLKEYQLATILMQIVSK